MDDESKVKLIDTHCHLDFPEFNQDRDEVIKRARDSGLEHIINISFGIEGAKWSLELSRKYNFIHTVIGVHPHEADKTSDDTVLALEVLARGEKVSAIGETGLDYFKNFSQADNQRRLFISLVKLAKNLNLPLVIHSRSAQEDTLKIVKQMLPLRAVVHCFSGDENFMRECLDLGFFISFTCNITYRKADNLRKLIQLAPLNRLFLETDAPFLAPEGLRGKRNEPMNVKLLAEEVARIRGISIEEVARVTTLSAKGFFGIA